MNNNIFYNISNTILLNSERHKSKTFKLFQIIVSSAFLRPSVTRYDKTGMK